jgi:MscS family membrane protein
LPAPDAQSARGATMFSLHSLLQQTYFGNTVESYLWFFGILLVGLALKRAISKMVARLFFRVVRKQGRHVGADKFLELLAAPVGFLFLLIIIYTACNRLHFPDEWKLVPENVFGLRFVLRQLFEGALVVAVTWIVLRLIDFFGLVLVERARQTESKSDDQLVPFLKEGVKVIFAGIGLLITLAVAFDLDVVSLVTGLGIGGLAFALAAKETLENLLGSFTIFLDKPFRVGDHVKVGLIEGKVESIGFRSTRLRALDRMLVVLPNKKMVDAELINESDREVRRSKQIFSLDVHTTPEQLQAVLADIRAYLEVQPGLEPNAIVNFTAVSQGGFEVLVIYIVKTAEWSEFLLVQESIHLEIIRILSRNGTSIAVPAAPQPGPRA